MGLITSIRKRLWLVTVLMAIALLGFIVMDMTTGKSGSLFNNSNTLGKVAGKSLDWTEFQRKENVLYQNSNVDYYGRKEYMWEQFVEEALLDKEAKNNGLGVSESEMNELQFGNNISPIVERNFRDPNTGAVNRDQLAQFKANMDNGQLPPQAKEFWKIQEEEIKKDRMYSKLNTIIQSALYQPDFMIEKNLKDGNTKMKLLYSKIPYSAVKDEDVKITDEDLKNYLKKNPGKFTNLEETRDLNYVVININPTAEDSTIIRNLLEEKKTAFNTIQNDSNYIVSNFGKWDEKLYKEAELSPLNSKALFSAPKGTVVGPYIEDGEMRIAKILDRKMIPDSVQSRHILVQVKTQAEAVAGRRLLDSLQNVLEKGQAKFADLARQYSQDQGSGALGGDLGYSAINRMVKEFNDLIFYKAVPGKYYIIATQFGFHLVEVTNQKFTTKTEGIKLGIIAETIQPGETIIDDLYNKAQDLVQQNRDITSFKKAIEANPSYKLEIEPQIGKSTFKIPSLGEGASSTVRDITRWLYNPSTELGDVSPEVYSLQDEIKKFTNRYIIAAYSAKNPKGTISMDKVRKDATQALTDEFKYNTITKGIPVGVSEITGSYGTYTEVVDTAKDVTLLEGRIGNNKGEYNAVAEISKKGLGGVVGPVKGSNGVYFIKMLEITPSKGGDPKTFKRFYVHPAKNTGMGYLMEAMKKNENIKDLRSKFY